MPRSLGEPWAASMKCRCCPCPSDNPRSQGGTMSAPLRLRRPEVIRQVGARTDSEENLKFYLDRLIKMIPAESVSLYLVGSGVIPGGKIVVLGVWIVVCIISVVAVRVFGTADRKAGTP